MTRVVHILPWYLVLFAEIRRNTTSVWHMVCFRVQAQDSLRECGMLLAQNIVRMRWGWVITEKKCVQ